MKLSEKFPRYFLIAALLLLSGILCIMIQMAVTHPAVPQMGPSELRLQSEYYSTKIVPEMANVFPLLLFLNAGVALFILLVPLFWVWIWWFNRQIRDTVILLMQATVCILMWALGHNSFPKVYITYQLLSWPIIARMYLPHGWLEMLAFVLAGTTAFLTIDALKGYLAENENAQNLHPGEICLFILGRVVKIGLVILVFITIAAAIECFVTPLLVQAALEEAVRAAGIG